LRGQHRRRRTRIEAHARDGLGRATRRGKRDAPKGAGGGEPIDARDKLDRDAALRDLLGLARTLPEHDRIAVNKTHNAQPARGVEHKLIGSRIGLLTATCNMHMSIRPKTREHVRVEALIDKRDIGLFEDLHRAQRKKPRVSAPNADERNLSVHDERTRLLLRSAR
jgi:hypothetical protein